VVRGVEADRDAERAEAEALRTAIDELKAGQALMIGMHARELAVARTTPWRRSRRQRSCGRPRLSGRRGGAGRG
jgi:hypothetical protein